LNRTRYLLLSLVLLSVFAMASAHAGTCHFVLTDMWTVSVTEPDGTTTSWTHYEYGYVCDDGYLDWERPCGPAGCGGGGTGGTGGNTPPPPPPAPTGCSISECSRDCDAEYLAHSGAEMAGETIIEHWSLECGAACQEYSRAEWEACKTGCLTDCNLP
jgi:hypothetical protein